jgi:inorganic pyrophosphatase
MSAFLSLKPFDAKGRVQMIVETPRGSAIKWKLDEESGLFTVSRSLTAGLRYPFDWGFVPGTQAEDGDPVDALCLHSDASFPGALLPCRCLAFVDVDQESKRGRVRNPRLILAPDWEGANTFGLGSELTDRAKRELEHFFLNATLFTSKDARILGWGNAEAASDYLDSAIV